MDVLVWKKNRGTHEQISVCVLIDTHEKLRSTYTTFVVVVVVVVKKTCYSVLRKKRYLENLVCRNDSENQKGDEAILQWMV